MRADGGWRRRMHDEVRRMIHGEFVYPSYVLTVAAMIGVVVWSWVTMRRAEAAADRVRRR